MHENLRTTVNFKPEYNEIKSNAYKSTQWQTLGGGFRYNTFFMLYGNFRGIINSFGNFVPSHCDLFIQNYNGDVTIGLSKNQSPKLELVYHPLIDNYAHRLTVYVKPLLANEFILDKELKVEPTNPNHFTALSPEKREEINDFNGIPKNSIINLNIEFEGLSDTNIQNSKGSHAIFNQNNLRNSAFINSNNFIREGDQLLEVSYSSYTNPDIRDLFNPNSFVNGYIEGLVDKINNNILLIPLWYISSYVNDEGILFDFGCNPKIINVTY